MTRPTRPPAGRSGGACSSPCSCPRPPSRSRPTGRATWAPRPRRPPAASRPTGPGSRSSGRRAATSPHPVRGGSDAFIRRYDRAGQGPLDAPVRDRRAGHRPRRRGRRGGLTVLGSTDGSFSGSGGTLGIDDLFVRRYDRDGTRQWTRQFGTVGRRGPGRDRGRRRRAVRRRDDGRGARPGTNAPDDPDAFIRRYDRAGHVEWTRQFGTNDGDSADAVAVDGGARVRRRRHGRQPPGHERRPVHRRVPAPLRHGGPRRLDPPVGPGGRRPGAVGGGRRHAASRPSATRTPTRRATSRARRSSAATTAPATCSGRRSSARPTPRSPGASRPTPTRSRSPATPSATSTPTTRAASTSSSGATAGPGRPSGSASSGRRRPTSASTSPRTARGSRSWATPMGALGGDPKGNLDVFVRRYTR